MIMKCMRNWGNLGEADAVKNVFLKNIVFFLWRSLEIRILGQVHEFSRILYFLLTKKPPRPRIKFIIFPHTVRYIYPSSFHVDGDKKLTICEGKMPCVCLDSNLSRFITRDWRHFFPLPLSQGKESNRARK